MEKKMFTRKEILVLVVPMFFEQLLNYLVSFIDNVMVSSVGETAVASVSFANTLNVFFMVLFTTFAAGGGVIVSQYMGKKDFESAKLAVKQHFYVMILFSSLIMILAIIFGSPILKLVYGELDASIFADVKIYFLISAISYPLISIYQSGTAVLRCMGESKTSLVAAAFMNLFNCFGNYVFIYIFRWGVLGAAFSTLIARFVATVVVFVSVSNKKREIYLDNIFKFEYNPRIVSNIIRLGIPGSISGVTNNVAHLLASRILASLPVIQMAAKAVVNTTDPLLGIINSTMGLAITTTVSRSLGANDEKQARYYAKYFIKASYILGIGIQVVVLLFSKNIIALFMLPEATAALAHKLFIIHIIHNMFVRPLYLYSNVFQSAGDVKFLMKASIAETWICSVLGNYLFCKWLGFGVYGFYITGILNSIIYYGLIMTMRYRSGKWLKNKVI